MRGLEAAVDRILDRRLLRESPRPLAVGFSGGGDSLALLLMADSWARGSRRELIVLTVDHRLQPQSAAWTQACAAVAGRLGRPFRALPWEGAKPATGLPAAARAARHRLLAGAAREAGARVVLLGHTADDVLEARAMRAAGGTTPEPRTWSPSPAWPEGRGIFLLRPLLDVRRAALRDWLAARGETWIEDPANVDPRYARARARRLTREPSGPVARADPPPLRLAEACVETAGMLGLPRAALRGADAAEARRFVAIAAVCAGGGERPPATARVARAAEALAGPEPFVATLAGARLQADDAVVHIFREPGEAARGGLAPLAPPPGVELVWDGRFELVAAVAGRQVRRLAGLAARLPLDQRQRLRDLPPAARGALPAVVDAAGAVSSPVLGETPAVRIRSLVGERLRAAAGLIDREPG